jgi:hypothetical protein
MIENMNVWTTFSDNCTTARTILHNVVGAYRIINLFIYCTGFLPYFRHFGTVLHSRIFFPYKKKNTEKTFFLRHIQTNTVKQMRSLFIKYNDAFPMLFYKGLIYKICFIIIFFTSQRSGNSTRYLNRFSAARILCTTIHSLLVLFFKTDILPFFGSPVSFYFV